MNRAGEATTSNEEFIDDIALVDGEAQPLNTEQVSYLRDVFNFFDIDGKGKVNR